jgi:hypothetical protein
MFKTIFYLLFVTMMLSCETSKTAVTKENSQLLDHNFETYFNEQNMSWGKLDTVDNGNQIELLKGPGVNGRKIIYRDVSAIKSSINTSGIIDTKVCIDKNGLVTYAEILQNESTIKDKSTLKKYLRAAIGYKFEAILSAPIQECGTLKFTIDNFLNKKIR